MGPVVFASYPQYRYFLSQPVILEIPDVLRRPELTSKFRSLKDLDMARIIEILGHAEIVEVQAIRAVTRDAPDDKFLATARAAEAEYLITEDQDLLVLGEYEGVKIVGTGAFLGILRQKDHR